MSRKDPLGRELQGIGGKGRAPELQKMFVMTALGIQDFSGDATHKQEERDNAAFLGLAWWAPHRAWGESDGLVSGQNTVGGKAGVVFVVEA